MANVGFKHQNSVGKNELRACDFNRKVRKGHAKWRKDVVSDTYDHIYMGRKALWVVPLRQRN